MIRHRQGWRQVAEDLSLARRLRAKRIDVAIDLHGGPRSSWLTFASRARKRVGYDVSGRSWISPTSFRGRVDTRRVIRLLESMGSARAGGPGVCRPPTRRATASKCARTTAARAPQSTRGWRRLSSRRRIVMLHVGAGNEFRRWPESFSQVAAALSSSTGSTEAAIGAQSWSLDRRPSRRASSEWWRSRNAGTLTRGRARSRLVAR